MRALLLIVIIAGFITGAYCAFLFAQIAWSQGDHALAYMLGAAPILVLAALLIPQHDDME